jgi:hypothetical protein
MATVRVRIAILTVRITLSVCPFNRMAHTANTRHASVPKLGVSVPILRRLNGFQYYGYVIPSLSGHWQDKTSAATCDIFSFLASSP